MLITLSLPDHPFTSDMSMSLYLKFISCRQHVTSFLLNLDRQIECGFSESRPTLRIISGIVCVHVVTEMRT